MKLETKTILSWSYNRNLIQTNDVNITQIQQDYNLKNYKQNGDVALTKEDENKWSENLRIRGQCHMNAYQGGRNRSREE